MLKYHFIALPDKQETLITHAFDAPKELVFRIYTDPKLIPKWWGPRNLITQVEKMDVTPGGLWRFIQSDSKGKKFIFHGVYHDVVPTKRVVQTFEFEGTSGHVILETASFEEHDGVTVVTQQSVFQSVEDRDGMLSAGMEQGVVESFRRISGLLEEMR